jgi:hypothetical protein
MAIIIFHFWRTACAKGGLQSFFLSRHRIESCNRKYDYKAILTGGRPASPTSYAIVASKKQLQQWAHIFFTYRITPLDRSGQKQKIFLNIQYSVVELIIRPTEN